MFDFLKKKQSPISNEESNIEIVDTAIAKSETSLVEKITPAQLAEYMNNGQLIEIKNTVAAGLSKVVEHLPEMTARKGMDNLYRLDMNGVKGVLMSHGSGRTTTIIDETTKKIKDTATIHQVGTTPAQVLSNVMNVASVATGMYYMSEITNQLQHTERLLGGVKQFLEDEKKAEITAIYGELNKIYNDYQFCITDNGYNEPLLMANRNMLASIEQKLDADIEFYILQLNHSYEKFDDKDKTKVVEETMQDFCVHTVLLKQLFDLFCVKTVLEINYSDKSIASNDAFIESRKNLLLSKYNRINDELSKMSDVKLYLSNERYGFIDFFKAMQLDDAFKDAFKDISSWKLPMKYQLPAKVVENAIKNYKDKRKTNVEAKSTEIENNVGGFSIEPPTRYTEIIDNLSMLTSSCPDLILDNGRVYMLKDC